MKSCYSLLFACLLAACAPRQKPRPLVKDTHGFEILMGQLAHHIEQRWGANEVVIAGPKDYVKYSDHYQTRVHINFQQGTLTVETLAGSAHEAQTCLQRALVDTLLMHEAACYRSLFDEQPLVITTQPFLYQQIVDQHQKPIANVQQAEAFTRHLLQYRLQQRLSQDQSIFTLILSLAPNHLNQRAQKYLRWVQQAARDYQLDESLILAIIQTESSFNPYAISGSQALGLMQVQQDSAGRDVFAHIKRRRGKPSRRYLFNPSKNIDTGTAYLHLLHTHYLGKIHHPLSRRYAAIAAYNSGTSAVLRTFATDHPTALSIINQLSPDQVYQTLLTCHPSSQARHYLHKVQRAQQYYQWHRFS